MEENVTLRFKQGSSDKVYKAHLLPKDGGWLVNFAYGRYGKPLKAGTKTAKPIPYDQAKYAYDKLVTEKQAKGYTPEASGTPFTAPTIDSERTGWLPQLLNPVEVEDAYTAISGWTTTWGQVKHDGERRGVIIRDGKITPSNRRGLQTNVDPIIYNALRELRDVLPFDLTLDCEDMGEYLVIFDCIVDGFEDADFNLRVENLEYLKALIDEHSLGRTLRVDYPALISDHGSLFKFLAWAEGRNEEGIVLRQGESQYTPGRPNSFGPALKVKFYASNTFQVISVHPTKASIALGIRSEPGLTGVGNCTIPPNYRMPGEGDLVEVKYLYAYRNGSVYQPQYKGIRTDIPHPDDIRQLKFKD